MHSPPGELPIKLVELHHALLHLNAHPTLLETSDEAIEWSDQYKTLCLLAETPPGLPQRERGGREVIQRSPKQQEGSQLQCACFMAVSSFPSLRLPGPHENRQSSIGGEGAEQSRESRAEWSVGGFPNSEKAVDCNVL